MSGFHLRVPSATCRAAAHSAHSHDRPSTKATMLPLGDFLRSTIKHLSSFLRRVMLSRRWPCMPMGHTVMSSSLRRFSPFWRCLFSCEYSCGVIVCLSLAPPREKSLTTSAAVACRLFQLVTNIDSMLIYQRPDGAGAELPIRPGLSAV